MGFESKVAIAAAVVITAVTAIAGGLYFGRNSGEVAQVADPAQAAADATAPTARSRIRAAPDTEQSAPTLELSESQLAWVKVEPVGERLFPIEKTAVGSIGFNEDMAVQVFTPYPGRIIGLFAKIGDDVDKGRTLFTIDSPDLLQAESTLIGAAGVLDMTSRALARLNKLFETRAVAQKDLEQASAEQQTAEANLKAARDNVRLFGKSDAEIDRIIAERRADPVLVVPSPIAGRVTARNAAPGLFVQPGNVPAPYAVADIDTMWMLANVAEIDSPALRVGQRVKVAVDAFPDRTFDAKIITIGEMVDPNTRRVLVRSEVEDPGHELRAGMFATFVIVTGVPMRSVAIPLSGVVREGDGTMTVWVTTDRRHFTRRTVQIGLERDGYRQILSGLQAGENAVTEGAIFLSNMLAVARAQ
jgi:membrane fusion protein, heavy metal efflux system